MLLELGKGNNGETFEALIRCILGWIDQPHKTVVVMDNAQYHRKKDRIEEFTNRAVSILFLPPSSSDLNPIGKYCFSFLCPAASTLFRGNNFRGNPSSGKYFRGNQGCHLTKTDRVFQTRLVWGCSMRAIPEGREGPYFTFLGRVTG